MTQRQSLKNKVFTTFRIRGRYKELNDREWRELEKIWKGQIRTTTRKELDLVNLLYSAVGPLHASTKTSTVLLSSKAIDAWIKASGRLRKELKARKTSGIKMSKGEIIRRFASPARLKRMPPVVFAQYVIDAAIGAALLAVDEIQTQNMAPSLQRDLWKAWVIYVAKLASDNGIKVTASSSNKQKNESSFVLGILYLQHRMPLECRHYKTYESVVKGVAAAKKKYSNAAALTLLANLAIQGQNVRRRGASKQSQIDALVSRLLKVNKAEKEGRAHSRYS